MVLALNRIRIPSLLVLASLVVLPNTCANEGQAPTAPALLGSYDPQTQGLTLTWPTSDMPNGTVYNLYRNGQAVGQPASNVTTRDLSMWLEGVREYTLTATLPDGAVLTSSAPFRVLKNVQVPTNCQVASVSIYTRPPGASYTIYDDCLAR